MVPALLVQEIVIALAGGAGLWAVGMLQGMPPAARQTLQAGVFLTTVYLMGRFGGLW